MTSIGITKTDLFVAHTWGHRSYRIPGLMVTARGTVMAYCEARLGQGGDYDDLDIALRRSTDGGITWDEPRLLADHRAYGGGCLNNPIMLADHNTGRVHLVFCHRYAKAFHCFSDDDGLTFGAPREITQAFEGFRAQLNWNVLAVGPGHGIQLTSGRLLAPVWLTAVDRNGPSPNRAGTLYSDDGGKTWCAGELISTLCPNCNEALPVQLADGSVMLNMRNQHVARRRAVAVSKDGVSGWSEPWLDGALVEPRCAAGFCRYSLAASDGRTALLFSHPDNLVATHNNPHLRGYADRINLSVHLSYDEGSTWPTWRTLEAGYSGYSDLAVIADKTILCFYERDLLANPPADNRFLTLARFDLEWLTGGADSAT